MLRRLYSQAGQDLWVIRDVFGWRTGGFFVEIGAADGVHLSNTCALERNYGWTGICVEANAQTFAQLRANRSCRCVHACIDQSAGEAVFDSGRGLFGGILPEGSSGGQKVATTTLAEVLEREQAPPVIDYLSVDVEGAEGRVMKTFPFATHRFLAATIERPDAALRELLASQGYRLVGEIPNLDAFYLHPDLCVSYRVRSMIAAKRRSLPILQRLAEDANWLLRHGVRAAWRRL